MFYFVKFFFALESGSAYPFHCVCDDYSITNNQQSSYHC